MSSANSDLMHRMNRYRTRACVFSTHDADPPSVVCDTHRTDHNRAATAFGNILNMAFIALLDGQPSPLSRSDRKSICADILSMPNNSLLARNTSRRFEF